MIVAAGRARFTSEEIGGGSRLAQRWTVTGLLEQARESADGLVSGEVGLDAFE